MRESRGGRTLTGAALCGRIACSERINLVGGRGWGWRCQAYFWECTDLITIEFAVCDEKRNKKQESEKYRERNGRYMWKYGGLNRSERKKGSWKESQKGDMIPDGPCDGSQRESKK